MQFKTIALFAASAALVAAQDSSIPACAQSCFAEAIGKTTCSLTDYLCQCTTGKDIIKNEVTPCLLKSTCTTGDVADINAAVTKVCAAAVAASGSASGSSAASGASGSASGTASGTASMSASSGAASAPASVSGSASSAAASGTASRSASAAASSSSAATGGAGVVRVGGAILGLSMAAVLAL
ncbi:CFEM domain-containing protein 5 [Elsinoe fawcettii]|nr:CFEM domain-containing protein 5 [Elsinoe fawcettii]